MACRRHGVYSHASHLRCSIRRIPPSTPLLWEIYNEHALDLLADRAPLSVGSKKAGRSVGGGPTCFAHANIAGSGSGAAVKGAVGAAMDFHGVHPPGCRCGKCHAAKKAELAARLAKRDALQSRTPVAPPRPRAGPSAAAAAADDDEEVGTVGETRVELTSAADVAKLARTVELTRVAVGHLLNARSRHARIVFVPYCPQRGEAAP